MGGSEATGQPPPLLRTPQMPVFLQIHRLLVLAKKWTWGQLISVRAECEGSNESLQS